MPNRTFSDCKQTNTIRDVHSFGLTDRRVGGKFTFYTVSGHRLWEIFLLPPFILKSNKVKQNSLKFEFLPAGESKSQDIFFLRLDNKIAH